MLSYTVSDLVQVCRTILTLTVRDRSVFRHTNSNVVQISPVEMCVWTDCIVDAGIPPRFLPRVRWPRSLFTRVSSFESYKKSGNRVPRVRQSPPSVSLGESVNDSGELSKPWRMSTRRRNLHQCNIDKTRPIHFKLCSLLSSSHGTSA